ncbi:MAG: BON domain-containing protein [Pseudomonadota bacterium]
MNTDIAIKKNVDAELHWTPQLDEKDIASTVTNGVVTLSGYVHSFYEKYQAEVAAKRLAGVAAVANDIVIRFATDEGITDPELARNVATAIKFQLPVSWENVKAIVNHGHIFLDGQVEWHFQREGIESAIRHLQGVLSVNNQISLIPRVTPTEIRLRIEDAFRRSAEVDANHISVHTNGGQVVLRGKVSSWAEREEAQRTAWSAPGVTLVTNEIVVGL